MHKNIEKMYENDHNTYIHGRNYHITNSIVITDEDQIAIETDIINNLLNILGKKRGF